MRVWTSWNSSLTSWTVTSRLQDVAELKDLRENLLEGLGRHADW